MIVTTKVDPIQKAINYPRFRYMGSKHKLLPWLYDTFKELDFDSAVDGFSGSGAVSFLLKAMGKQVYSNDFLQFSTAISRGLVCNSAEKLSEEDILNIKTKSDHKYENFIAATFKGIFFNEEDLAFLDVASQNILLIENQDKSSLAMTCLIRSCLKKQPRGVFTVSGDLSRYDDGRRDLKLSMEEHFNLQVKELNELVFDNGKDNLAQCGSIFELENYQPDLVYFDPPYVPKSDDNCYTKRYHFVEGLSKYWKGETIMEKSKVKKIEKKYTPFSYKRSAVESFDKLFNQFRDSIIVLSYSSNAFPELNQLVDLMSSYKQKVRVEKREHRYHFGNHISAKRNLVEEYLIIGE